MFVDFLVRTRVSSLSKAKRSLWLYISIYNMFAFHRLA